MWEAKLRSSFTVTNALGESIENTRLDLDFELSHGVLWGFDWRRLGPTMIPSGMAVAESVNTFVYTQPIVG
jgi:hypothetical protein